MSFAMAGLKIVSFMCTIMTLCIAEASNRNDRIWPVGQSSSVDLPQSSPFGPRLQISRSSRYDFHRGIDIPIPIGTPLVAIDNGTVRIAGSHDLYSDGVVQIIHQGWDEDPEINFYVNYIHIINATVTENEEVVKGQIVAYSFRSSTTFSQFEHLHFEVRVGGLYQANCCNPWKYLPNIDNTYTSFAANIQLYPNYNGLNCEAVVNVSIAASQLTMNRIELHITNAGMDSVRTFDFCEDNLDHTLAELDNPLFEGNLYISPGRFNSKSFERGENATYGFHFLHLPETQSEDATLQAIAYDVFGNRVQTSTMQYTCIGSSSTTVLIATTFSSEPQRDTSSRAAISEGATTFSSEPQRDTSSRAAISEGATTFSSEPQRDTSLRAAISKGATTGVAVLVAITIYTLF